MVTHLSGKLDSDGLDACIVGLYEDELNEDEQALETVNIRNYFDLVNQDVE